MNDLISVIIPVYNVEKYLKKCINSVLIQSYKNLQIILVDDGSTDMSPIICDEYAKLDNRIFVIHKKNGGLSSARNAGLKAAIGNYITFLDSDDYISSTTYEELYTILEERKDRIACTCFRRVDETGLIYDKKDLHRNQDIVSNIQYLRELLLHVGDASVCTKLFPREVLKNKFFDEDILNEDFIFMFDLVSNFKEIVYTGSIGYFYLIRKNSISNGYGKALEDMALNAINVNEIIQKQYANLNEEGDRFALFQNMAYLLFVPKQLRNTDNRQYIQSLKYLKKNFFDKGLKNKYLTLKNKAIICGLILCPKTIIWLFQRKRGL